jgi:hypothetical protein
LIRAAWAVAAAAAVAACTLDPVSKDHCQSTIDCLSGYVCVGNRCVAGSDGGGAGGSEAGGGAGGAEAGGGAADAGNDAGSDADGGGGDAAPPAPPPPGMCNASAVSTCAQPPAGELCEEAICGGRLWKDGVNGPWAALVPYRIWDPAGLLSDVYKNAIRDSAAAWQAASAGLVSLTECTSCTGRFVSIVPGDGDGILDPDAPYEQHVPVPADPASLAQPPLHRIAHQWGHVLGLDDTYRRADRDRYVTFDPAVWCREGGPGIPARCALDPAAQQGSASFASDTYGVYDETSKMNGFASDGVCGAPGAPEPDPTSDAPTAGDVSALSEMFFALEGPWAPFQPVGRSAVPGQPFDYQLAPGVDPVGGPAVAYENAPVVDIFVRGSDGHVYITHNDLLFGTTFVDWAPWVSVADNVDADPTVASTDDSTLYLLVRAADGEDLRLRRRAAGVWSDWASLGVPPVVADSAPALAAIKPGAIGYEALGVVVRGADGLIYALTCTDPQDLCAASAASDSAWQQLPSPPSGAVIGKPSVAWMSDNNTLLVAAVTTEREVWVIGSTPTGWGTWVPAEGFAVSRDDAEPGVAVAGLGGLSGMNILVRDPRGLLLLGNIYGSNNLPLGGVLASAPGVAVAKEQDGHRVDIVALIDDHHHPGVWWKFRGGFTPPCNYKLTGTCTTCGCGGAGQPSCDH